MRFIITGGQASEYGEASSLIEGYSPGFVIADKGYDSDAFVKQINDAGATAVIPSKRNRNEARDYDKHIYKDRNLVERLFQKLKHYRRIATRYERVGKNYLSMLSLVASVIWLN